MNVPTSEPEPTGVRPGCLVVLGAFALGAAIVVLVSYVLMGRGDGSVALGTLDSYAVNSVVYRSSDGLLVERTADGSVVAFSDLDPHNPPGRSSCLVTFRPDLSLSPVVGVPSGPPGVFFDICTGAMYDLSGHGLSGDGLNLRSVRVEQDKKGRLKAFPRG